jgi:hypothetical protein
MEKQEAVFEIYGEHVKVTPIDNATLSVEDFEPEVEGSAETPVTDPQGFILIPPGCFHLRINNQKLPLYWNGDMLLTLEPVELIMRRPEPN